YTHLYFTRLGHHRDLHSFPTRRSSDLNHQVSQRGFKGQFYMMGSNGGVMTATTATQQPIALVESGPVGGCMGAVAYVKAMGLDRSEEQTSELQSRENLVCRLLLEKKNT